MLWPALSLISTFSLSTKSIKSECVISLKRKKPRSILNPSGHFLIAEARRLSAVYSNSATQITEGRGLSLTKVSLNKTHLASTTNSDKRSHCFTDADKRLLADHSCWLDRIDKRFVPTGRRRIFASPGYLVRVSQPQATQFIHKNNVTIM